MQLAPDWPVACGLWLASWEALAVLGSSHSRLGDLDEWAPPSAIVECEPLWLAAAYSQAFTTVGSSAWRLEWGKFWDC